MREIKTKVKIIAGEERHRIPIGTIVEITHVIGPTYGCTGAHYLRWFYEDDCESVKTMSKCKHKNVKLGYLEQYYDSQKRFKKGEKEIQCPICKLWIWESEYFKERKNEKS